jgi:hypothetical protein
MSYIRERVIVRCFADLPPTSVSGIRRRRTHSRIQSIFEDNDHLDGSPRENVRDVGVSLLGTVMAVPFFCCGQLPAVRLGVLDENIIIYTEVGTENDS